MIRDPHVGAEMLVIPLFDNASHISESPIIRMTISLFSGA
jgi:hypothetical protein